MQGPVRSTVPHLPMSIAATALVLVAVTASPTPAKAGGLFYAGSGTRSLGRGAAFLVKADDPMALLYSPASLADLVGTQLLANFNLALLHACANPAGTVRGGVPTRLLEEEPNGTTAGTVRDRGTYKENFSPDEDADLTRFGSIPRGANNTNLRKTWVGTTMPTVCNDTARLPVPNFVLTYQLARPGKLGGRPWVRGLTVALGMVVPGAVTKTTWGDEDGTVRVRGHASQREVDAAAPTSGIGRPLPPGVRPDAVCDPATDASGCAQYCDPETDRSCPAGKQYFCDPTKYDCDKLPTPTRYMLVQQDPFAIPITLGVGYRPFSWLAVGAAFTYQAIFFKSTVYATQLTASRPEFDMRVENELVDWFVPIVNGSIKVTPIQGVELMGYYKWQDRISGSTKSTVIDAAYSVGGREGRLPVRSVVAAGAGLVTEVPQPWEAGGGIRIAVPRGGFASGRSRGAVGDPMTAEIFDIEADFVFEHNSSVRAFSLSSRENAFKVFQGYDGDDPEGTGSVSPTDPNCNTVPGAGPPVSGATRCTRNLVFFDHMKVKRNWKDQFVVRLGGDYNVIPGVLALRAGVNFETRGVTPSYQSLDAFPARRLGLHGGLTFRVRRLDLSVAYGHIFQEQIRVLHADATDETGRTPARDRAALRAASPDETASVVNAGSYRASWNVLSLGLAQRF